MKCFVMYASSRNADFYYLTRFKTSDPCVYVVCEDTELLVVPKMEVNRASRESRVREIASYEDLGYKELVAEYGRAAISELIVRLLKECRAKVVAVPDDFPASIAFRLREEFEVVFENPAREKRMVKTSEEVREIAKVCEATLLAFDWVVRNFGFSSCEELRNALEAKLYELGLLAEDTIAASGRLSADPHERGSGVIEDHVVLDVFPRSRTSMYYADFTRTIFVERNGELEEMYGAVVDAQEEAIKMLRDGVDARDVHQRVVEVLNERGFKTRGGEGFVHSTGHGVGLEVHEEPRIGERSCILKRGMVVTVEPGLYYRRIGGVRCEDLVVIKKNGCEVLTKYPKWIRLYEGL
ncbi:MAG: Xaa-Pro peptidase family protein [Archaeoglobaceae archaeon]